MEKKEKKIEMGGQAVIEGVMMRSPMGYTIAVRKKDKTIKIKSIPYVSITKKYKIFGLPFIRGVFMLFEMLVLGLKGLDYSANEWEEEEDSSKEENPSNPGKESEETENPEKKNEEQKDAPGEEKRQISVAAMAGLMAFSIGLALVMMVVLPNVLTHIVGVIIDFFSGAERESVGLVESKSPIIYNLVAGFFRACFLLAYIWVISFSKDIRRVFEYHGAEHKAVFAFEDKKDLTLDNVRPYTTRHPRCGTTFLGVVIIVSIIVFAFLVKAVAMFFPAFLEMNLVLRKLIIIGLHIVFMPLVAGISYEIIKYSSRHLDNPILRLLTVPGLLSQHLTTKEPDDEQLEVSIASLKAALNIGKDQERPETTILYPGEALENN